MFLKLLVVIYAATSLSALPASTAGGSAYKLPAHSITAKQSRLPLHQAASPVRGPSTSVAPRLSAGPKISLLGGLNKPGLKATDNSNLNLGARSEERRVGKECRTRCSAYYVNKRKR